MRNLFLALIFCLFGSATQAQNIMCPDRPGTDSSNACANTRFVQTTPITPGKLPTPTLSTLGAIYAFNGITSQWPWQLNTDGTFTFKRPAGTDVTFLQDGTGAVDTTIDAILKSNIYYTPEFGIAADGTDQASKINAALTACAARGGGLLYLPGATTPYMIGSSINPTEGCGIVGDGMSVRYVQQDQAGTTPKTTIKALPSFNGVMINFPARTFAPYTAGTVNVTNGSTTVTCSGCNFSSNIPVSAGAFKVSGDTVSYVVASRTTTSLTLTTAYQGTTASGKSYTADSLTVTKKAIESWYTIHITFDGNKDNGATATGVWYDPGNAASIGVQTQDARHRWDDVAVVNMSGYGAYLGPPHRAIRFDGFRAEKNSFDGIRTEGSDYTFSNLMLGENSLCGLNVLGGVSVKIMSGEAYTNYNNLCVFDSTYFTALAGGGNLPTSGLLVSNFEFDRATHDSVNIGGGSYGVVMNNIAFGGGDGSASCGTYSMIALSSSYAGPALKINGGFAQENVTPGSPCAKYVFSFGGSAFADVNGFEAKSGTASTAVANNNTFLRRYSPNGSAYTDANNKSFGAGEFNDVQTFDAPPVLKTLSGLLKGNNTSAISVATSGTDYAPATSGSAILKGNGAGGFSSAVSGTDYAPATSGASILKGNGAGGFSSVSAGQLPATATNDNASAGNVGEYVSSSIASGSAVSLTSGTPANLTSISLTAGDWDAECNAFYIWGATTLGSYTRTSLSTTSATTDFTQDRYAVVAHYGISVADTSGWTTLRAGSARFSLSGTTTVYCVADTAFTTSTLSVFGILRARRVR